MLYEVITVYGDYMEEEPFCNYIPNRTRKRMEQEARNNFV